MRDSTSCNAAVNRNTLQHAAPFSKACGTAEGNAVYGGACRGDNRGCALRGFLSFGSALRHRAGAAQAGPPAWDRAMPHDRTFERCALGAWRAPAVQACLRLERGGIRALLGRMRASHRPPRDPEPAAAPPPAPRGPRRDPDAPAASQPRPRPESPATKSAPAPCDPGPATKSCPSSPARLAKPVLQRYRLEEFEIEGGSIGSGSYGSVNKVVRKGSGEVFAMKKIPKKKAPRRSRSAQIVCAELSAVVDLFHSHSDTASPSCNIT